MAIRHHPIRGMHLSPVYWNLEHKLMGMSDAERQRVIDAAHPEGALKRQQDKEDELAQVLGMFYTGQPVHFPESPAEEDEEEWNQPMRARHMKPGDVFKAYKRFISPDASHFREEREGAAQDGAPTGRILIHHRDYSIQPLHPDWIQRNMPLPVKG